MNCISSVLFQAGGRGIVGKRSVKASATMTSLWTPPVGGDVSLEDSKSSQAVHISTTCGKHNVSVTAALSNVAEVNVSGTAGFSKNTVKLMTYINMYLF